MTPMSYPLSLYQPTSRLDIAALSRRRKRSWTKKFLVRFKRIQLLFYSCFLKICTFFSVAAMKISLCFWFISHCFTAHANVNTLSGLIWRSHSRPRKGRPCSPSSPSSHRRCSSSCWRWRSGVCRACSRTRWAGASGRPGLRDRRIPPRTGRRRRRSLRLARGRQQTGRGKWNYGTATKRSITQRLCHFS